MERVARSEIREVTEEALQRALTELAAARKKAAQASDGPTRTELRRAVGVLEDEVNRIAARLQAERARDAH